MQRIELNRVMFLVAGCTVLMASAAWSADSPASRPAGNPTVDISTPGAYRSGLWEYRMIVTSPGSKSEGIVGKLFFAGKPVEEPASGDYYRTPWGEIAWVGNSPLLWGEHGWIPRTPGVEGGRELPEPWSLAGGPVVMAMVLCDAEATPEDGLFEPWVKAGMQKLGAKGFSIQRPWFPLTEQAVTIHDTKLYGTLTARLCPARDTATLTIVLDGTEPGRVELPRQDGATALVLRTLGGVLDTANNYLAFRVDRAAPDWPRPLDIGPESDGREVMVKGVKEIVIGLPGDKGSGCVWMVKRVQGDAPTTSSVTASGDPQFVPAMDAAAGTARSGVFENVLHVTGTGKTYVELEYKRTWQTDKPAEKTFTVTLDVQGSPAGAAKP